MNKGRISRRGAIIAAALTVVATPAFASLVVQNYMEADISLAEACFVKVAGDDIASYTAADADDPNATFDGADNTIQVDGADLLEEKLTVRGMVGDRVTYTDVVRYQNRCDIPLDVTLRASGAKAVGDWKDRSARIYISSAAGTIGGAGATFTGYPGDLNSGWHGTPIVVEANTGDFPATNTATGTVTIQPNQELYGAISVSAGTDSAVAGIGTVNWVAEAVHAN